MIKPGFDLIAPAYDFLARLVFGRAILKAQLVYLSEIPNQAHILIIGGGTGWLLPEIFARTPAVRIVYLEASVGMLHQARQKVNNSAQASRIEFRLGTEKNIGPTEKFDVVISNFLLDLFKPEELEPFTRILYQSLQLGGYWLITDFVRVSGSGTKQMWANLLIRSMYLFFRLVSKISATTLPNWQNCLSRYHLVGQKSAYFYHSLIKSVLYQKL